MEPEYYDLNELAERYKLSRKTLRNYAYARRIPGTLKIGGNLRFRRDAIHRAEASGKLLQK